MYAGRTVILADIIYFSKILKIMQNVRTFLISLETKIIYARVHIFRIRRVKKMAEFRMAEFLRI